MDGWIKLWRKSISSGLIRNHNVWVFWTYCLLKANHEPDYKQTVGFQEVILQPGQFIFGRKKASEDTGLSEQNIRTCLAFLKKCQNLTIKVTNKFSIIAIINWDTYQKEDGTTNQLSNQHVTSNQPASNQQVTTNKNLRTKEPEKKDIPPLPPKPKKSKKVFIPPTKEEVISFFIANEYDGNKGANAFDFYAEADWFDSRGNKVKNWKQKMRGVWFKDDNRVMQNKVNGAGQPGTMTNAERWVQSRRARENGTK